jgi:hypothetical protein
MGACDFEAYGTGKTVGEAFGSAVNEAQWEHGHGGYSGTIAEKHGFSLIPDSVIVDKSIRPRQLVGLLWEALYEDEDGEGEARVKLATVLSPAADVRRILEMMEDKWGDALALRAPDTEAGEKRWLFFGLASS